MNSKPWTVRHFDAETTLTRVEFWNGQTFVGVERYMDAEDAAVDAHVWECSTQEEIAAAIAG